MFEARRSKIHAASRYHAVLRQLGLDADGVFRDARIVPWRTLPERDNCTLDATLAHGKSIRLHVKRFRAEPGVKTPAEGEAQGYRALMIEKIPTAPLVAWGVLSDRRSFLITEDLAGYEAADKLVERGLAFDRLLEPTADLTARLHEAGLHHRDLYLCHFFAKASAAGGDHFDLRLIDAARVRRLPGWPTRSRWIVKDLAQFWFSTLRLEVSDDQRRAWLRQYCEKRRMLSRMDALAARILRKSDWITSHDKRLRSRQPTRNVSIPPREGGSDSGVERFARPADLQPPDGVIIRGASEDDAEQMIAHVCRLTEELDIDLPLEPGEFDLTVEDERRILRQYAASPNSVFLVAEARGQIISVLNLTGGQRRADVHMAKMGLSVRRDWRGKGVGSAMIARAIEWARVHGLARIELQVYDRNTAAIRLYERFGFVTEGIRRSAVRHRGKAIDDRMMGLLV